MHREDVRRWLEDHPDAVQGDASELLERCERSVRRHASEDAWLHAKAYVSARARAWDEAWSAPASEAFVAREVCHQLAWELRRHEPHPDAHDAEHLAGGPVVGALTPEGWSVLRSWVCALADEAEHATWRDVVRYTDRRARALIRERHWTLDSEWDEPHRYTAIAAHVARILAREYSQRAHPREPAGSA